MADEIVNVNDVSEREALDSKDDNNESNEESTEETIEETESEDSEEESGDDEEAESESEDEDSEETVDENDSLYKQLKTKHKDIFKEIPELKEVIFREQAYTKVFATVKDAEEASEAAEIFAEFKNDAMSGNPSNLLEAIKSTDEDALKDFVGNFTSAVENMSKDLYYDMMAPEFKKLFRIFVKSNDEAVSQSAKNLHYMVFGKDARLEDNAGLKANLDKKSAGEDKVTKREREFEERITNQFQNEIHSVSTNKIERFIASAFKESGLSQLMQDKLTEEIFKRVGSELDKDARHMGNMNSLWKQAKAKGLTSDWKDRIVNAYLSRAKALVPKHRQKVLAEAKIGGKIEKKEGKTVIRVTPTNNTNASNMPAGKVDPKRVNWDKTSDRDMLDGKVTLRK